MKMLKNYQKYIQSFMTTLWQLKSDCNKSSKSLLIGYEVEVTGRRNYTKINQCEQQLYSLAGPSCTMEKTLTRRVMP